LYCDKKIYLSAKGEVSGLIKGRFAVIYYDRNQKQLLFRIETAAYPFNYICQLPQGLSVMLYVLNTLYLLRR